MEKIVTFGEMMLRLTPVNHQRILQTNQYEASYGGAEGNVAVSLSLLGEDASLVSKVPDNLIGESLIEKLLGFGVNTDNILRGGPRLGTYYFERGASLRNTNVTYDRKYSSFAQSKAKEYDWPKILQGTKYFYFSGITPAISPETEKAVLLACKYCHKHHIQVICDLNYRAKLWSTQRAQETMNKLMKYVDICLAHDEDFEASLGIKAFNGDMKHGISQKQNYIQGMKKIIQKFPQCKTVASILRNVNSVEDSQWTALMINNNQVFQAPIYHMHVLEGVASGDAFGTGLIHALIHRFSKQKAISYALAASVLKLTIEGDFNLVSDNEIRALMEKNKTKMGR